MSSGFAVEKFFTSIRDLADRIGVVRGAVYHYVESKETLLVQIVEHVDKQSRQILDDVLGLDISAIERLGVYVERRVDWSLRNADEARVAARDSRHLTDERRASALRRRARHERAVRALIVAAQADGDVDPAINPRYASLYLLGAVNHLQDLCSQRRGDQPARDAAVYGRLAVRALARPRSAGEHRVDQAADSSCMAA